MWWWPEQHADSQRHAELLPGGLSVVGAGWTLKTLVGSCVAVVLWHAHSRSGGMCHYVLSHRAGRTDGPPLPNATDSRYGALALPLLKARLAPFMGGGPGGSLIAHVIGGASMLDAPDGQAGLIGRANVELALRWVEQEGLQLGQVQVGGRAGRRIRFDTSTGALGVSAVIDAPASWPAAPWITSMWPA